MKLMVIYHPNSEGARALEDYAQRLVKDRGYKLEMLSLETREGAATASLYGVVRYPAVLVLDDVGHPQKDWQGDQLPTTDEVLGYLAA